jgi:hypothetical protein
LTVQRSEQRDDHRICRERSSSLIEVDGLAARHRVGDGGVGRCIDLHAVGRIAVRIERAQQHEDVAEHLVLIVLHFLEILQTDRRDAAVDGNRRDGAESQLVRAGADEQPHVLTGGELKLAGGIGCSVVGASAGDTEAVEALQHELSVGQRHGRRIGGAASASAIAAATASRQRCSDRDRQQGSRQGVHSDCLLETGQGIDGTQNARAPRARAVRSGVTAD